MIPGIVVLIRRHRVTICVVGLVIAFATNAWHKNAVSGAVAVVLLFALGAWLGGLLTGNGNGGPHP